VLDLGVIVVGAELGRLLADMGADVIKVENRAFPDGSRQTVAGEAMTAGFATGHRNKRSFGVDLRDPRGRDLFLRLVAGADVILSNFKPGTLESLGLGYGEIAAVNPSIVMADSSAFGPSGPWSLRMGYGPLVRASCGLTDLWRDPDVDDGHCDTTTIFPDHVAARVEAVAVLAVLVRRLRTGRGGTVSAAQAETILGELGTEIAYESVRPGSISARRRAAPVDAPRGVYPAAGDDEWVVVAVRDDRDFRALTAVVGRDDLADDPAFADPAGRLARSGDLDAVVSGWTAARSPRQAAEALQAAGVPAGMMQRTGDLASDSHLLERGWFAPMHHPLLATDLLVERSCGVFAEIADPERRPAPRAGEHTREIATSRLGLSGPEVESLLAAGVLEGPDPPDPAEPPAPAEPPDLSDPAGRTGP
jgi:crotonobetainyl-CoA:carnitine CoA-transferase CaiB-like acyl-CoA transferase